MMPLLPMVPQFPRAGSTSGPDPRGDLMGCSVKSFGHSSSKQTSTNLCPVPGSFWASGMPRDRGGRERWSRGSVCPVLSSCNWPFTASREAPSENLHEGAITSTMICSFHTCTNTHCMRGTEDAGVKDTESLPLGSSHSSAGNRSSTDYHRTAVRRK